MFYGADLAAAHDAGFGFLARGAAATVIDMLRGAGIEGGLVVDLACGSGITARLLGDAGYDVLGVDLSADMLRLAREHAPTARFERASLHDFELPRCVAVCAIGEALNYAADRRAGRAATARLFERIAAALVPGGLFLFDVAEPGRESAQPRRTWHEGEAWLVCTEAWEEPDPARLHRRIATFRRDGDAWRRSDERHVLELLTRDDVLADLVAAGFEARLLDHYGTEYSFRPGHRGFAAQAPR